MRLVGVSAAVCNALDHATPSACLLVYQASDWADELAGRLIPGQTDSRTATGSLSESE
jgi:hypothetical protein